MAQLVLNLSGGLGLGNKFFGDIDQITPTPHKRLAVNDGEMVAGAFNPFLREGFLSPSVSTLHAVTLDQTLNAVMGSAIYDHINDDYYMAERGRQIFQGDGLSDTSLARVKQLTPSESVLHDLEIYQVNGTRKLFYVYTTTGTTGTDADFSVALSTSVKYVNFGSNVNAAGAAFPTLQSVARDTEDSVSGTSTAFTVAAGTNRALIVHVFAYNTGSSTPTISAVYWDTATYSLSALVAGGGGGGGASTSNSADNGGGGGGAGGYKAQTLTGVAPGTYAITVGTGGAGGTTNGQAGSDGTTSSIGSLLSAAGGGGGGGGGNNVGRNGASGGGGGATDGAGAVGGTGTAGQGFDGGPGDGGADTLGGGGGGSSEAGNTDGVGFGGDGTASSISGASVTYAGGGGGGGETIGGTAGTGGAGNGGLNAAGSNADVNTGSGGGGGGTTAAGVNAGGNGAAGVVIISYTTGLLTATGGTITTSGGNTIHTFTTSGTFIIQGAQTLTALAANTGNQFDSGDFYDHRVFSLVAPTVGSGVVTVSFSASVTTGVVHIAQYNGVDQTTPLVTATDGGSIASNTTIVAHDLTIQNYDINLMTLATTGSPTHTGSSGTPEGVTQTELNARATNTRGTDSFWSVHIPFVDYRVLRVGIASLPFASADDNWLTDGVIYPPGGTVSNDFTNSTTSSYNFIRVADNGFAYLFADNAIHKIDGTATGGTNGTMSENVITFPPHFRIADAVDYRGSFYIAIHQSQIDPTSTTQTNYATPCGVYVWDRLSSVVQTRDYVPIEGVRVIKRIYVAPSGGLRLIVVSSDGTTQIREFNGSVFTIVKELGIGAAPQYVDSLTTTGTKTLWLAPDGWLYAHGQSIPSGPEALVKIGQIRAPQAETTAGYAENITAGAMLVGYGTDTAATGYRSDRQAVTLSYSTGTPLVKKFFPFDKSSINSTDQNTLQGDIFTGTHFLPTMSTVASLDIYCLAGTASGSTTQATVKIYFNGSATAWASKLITRDDVAKGYKHIEINKQYITSIQLEFEYPTNVALSDTYDFHPSYGVVEYEPTITKGSLSTNT